MKNLTEKKLTALKPREKRFTVALGGGLSVKVQPTGTKSFVLRIAKDGKVRDHFLGHFPALTLAQARQLARRKKKEVGQEPPPGYSDATTTGPFFKAGTAAMLPSGDYADGKHLGFDASREINLFGESDSVQPPSLRVLPCIKS